MTRFPSRRAPLFQGPGNAGDSGAAARLHSRRRLRIMAAFGLAVLVALALQSVAAAGVSFQTTVYLTGDAGSGTGTRSVAAADFDGDGDLDLAAANTLPKTVTVLYGDGTGGFGAANEIWVGNAESVVAADLDGDGDADLATVGEYMTVLYGDGSGGFPTTRTFSFSFRDRSRGRDVAAADLDGDGNLDLAVPNWESNFFGNVDAMSVLLGDGTGGFGAATHFGAGDNPSSVAAADLDGDGDRDLAVTNRDTLTVLYGDGRGGFPARRDFGVDGVDVAAADLDGDGDLDLAVVHPNRETFSVLLGDGSGGFGAATIFVGNNPQSVAAADFDGDGVLDLASGNNGPTVSVLLGDGSGAFGAYTDYNGGRFDARVGVAADLDGDGDPDLAVANDGGFNFPGSVAVLLNTTVRPTSVSSVFGSGTYGGEATLRAQLKSRGTLLAGKSISFTLDGVSVGSAVTNASGLAELRGVSLGNRNVGYSVFAVGASFAGDSAYEESAALGDLAVLKAAGSVAIANIPSGAVFGGSFTPTYTKAGDGPATTASKTPSVCSVSAGVVRFDAAGTCTLQASVAEGTNHLAATGPEQSFLVAKAAGSVRIDNIPGGAVFGGSFTPTYVKAGDGAASATSRTPGVCSVSLGVVSFDAAGTCTLVASVAEGTNHTAALGPEQSFLVAKAAGSIRIDNIPGDAVFGGSFTPAYAKAGDGVASTSSETPGVCSVSAGVVSFDAAGTCTLQASVAEGTNHLAATGPEQSFLVAKAAGLVTIGNIPDGALFGGSFTPIHVKAGDGVASTSSNTPDVCSVSLGVVFFDAAGTCTLQASVAEGTNHLAATGPEQSFVVAGFSFTGFAAPIDNRSVNGAKAGQAIPVKYRLTWPDGTPVSDPASFAGLKSERGGGLCTGLPLDPIEAHAAGDSGLRYLGDGNWQFNWKTPKEFAGQCRTMTLTLEDGSRHTATFRFR